MPVEGLSREAIRGRVAQNLMGVDYRTGSASANGSTTTLVDTGLYGGDDNFNGWWILFTSGVNDGTVRRISDYIQSTGTITWVTAVTSTVAADTYELFEPHYPPAQIHTAINGAITSAIGGFFRREESLALYGDGVTARFDLPSEFQMVNKLEYRAKVTSEVVHDCETTFDTVTDADITQSNDDQDRKVGQSLKLVIAGTVSDGDLIADDFGAKDLSRYTHLEGWCKAATALASNDFVIQLRETTATIRETLTVPAIAADTWVYFRIALSNPELDTAIDHIYLEYNANSAANTVWFDDIKVVTNDSAVWVTVPKNTWRLDREAQDIVLTEDARSIIGSTLIKLSGGSNPSQMTADADVATVPEDYLIAQATYLMLVGGSRATGEDTDGRRSLAREWLGMAQMAKSKFGILVNARVL